MTDIAAIEAAHNAERKGPTLRTDHDGTPLCWACWQRWPCDTAIVLARLHEQASSWQSSWDALYSDCAAAKARLHEVEAERDELGARYLRAADAARLADAALDRLRTDQPLSATEWYDRAQALLARLHEVEAERDTAAYRGSTKALADMLHTVEAERDAAVRYYEGLLRAADANAITPQQRAVLEAAVAWYRSGIDTDVSDDALYAAVDALLEAER